MARMSESKRITKHKQERDGANGPVLVIPHCVLNSEAYLSLSAHAVRLLFDITMQFNPKSGNNGSLLASRNHLLKRGWKSQDMITKSKRELIDRGLLVQTVQGLRPNKASWYAVTWLPLNKIEGIELHESHFPRGAYRFWTAKKQAA